MPHRAELSPRPPTRWLSPAELRSKVSGIGVTDQELDAYVASRMTGVRVHQTDVVFIDTEHPVHLDPVMKALVESPATNAVMVEYWRPELEAHATRWGIADRLDSLPKMYRDRIHSSDQLADIVQRTHLSVMTADIANKPEYQLSLLFFRMFPSVVMGVWGVSGIKKDWFRRVAPPVVAINLLWAIHLHRQWGRGEGIFDREKIGVCEPFVFDLEQARRVFVAKAIAQWAVTAPEANGNSQLIVLYPKAHSRRIIDYLRSGDSLALRGKEAVYRVFAVGLDTSLRTWKQAEFAID